MGQKKSWILLTSVIATVSSFWWATNHKLHIDLLYFQVLHYGIQCHFSYMWPNLPQIPHGVLSLFVDDFTNFLHGYIRAPCGGTNYTVTIFNQCFPTREKKKQKGKKTHTHTLKCLFIPVALLPNSVLSMSGVPNAVFQSLVHNVTQMHLSSHQLLENCKLH